MTTRERGLAPEPDPSAAPATTPTSSTSSVVEETRPASGEWPDTPASDELRDQWMREHARRELVMHSIRCHLAEQPSTRAARKCARRWIADINYLTDGVIAAMNQERE